MDPHVSPQVKTWSTRRRLDAGDDRRGEGARVLPTIDQIDCGLVLRVAGGKPRRLVAVGGARVAGNIAVNEFGAAGARVSSDPSLGGKARHGRGAL